MASQVLLSVSRDEEERARIMRDEKIELDFQDMIVTAKREGQKEILEMINQADSLDELKRKVGAI